MTSRTRYAATCIAATILLASTAALSQGMLIPKKQSIPALAIESHRVTVKIRDGVAKTTVDQVFLNDCGQQLEATYIFPLPKDASVSDFALWIGGKKQKGEILEKDEARKIYEGIVAKLKDPGLLEYMGGNLFKARVFPVPAKGTQKVQIAFTQKLAYHDNMYKYVYPLKTSGPSASTLKDFTFTGKIKSQVPIKTVYSPTHELEVQVEGGNRATVGFEKDKALLDRDLVLYYTVSKDRIGLNLLAHRTDDDEGTFMLLLAPGNDLPQKEIVGKQVTFVVDTSGSMSGEKMQRAKKALKYCLKHLGSDDLFNVIRFSSTTEPYFDSLVSASSKNVDEALERIEDINPLGGTAIEPALRTALKQKVEKGVPHFILFITDGMPTVGETDPHKIIDIVTKLNKGHDSLFAFGVGDDVNVNFLDKLVTENHGSTEYARTGGDLEMALSTMYAKIAYPALTDVSLEIDGIKARDVFPQQMPDLFYGGQVVVVGRYKSGGKAKITLRGSMGGKERSVKYKVKLPEAQKDNDFIEHIWATRKVGYLLDQIRLNGESEELREEVIALARRYGIVTPYTSYLVVEDESLPAPPPLPQPPPHHWSPPVPGAAAKSAAPSAPAYEEDAYELMAESAGDLSSGKAMGGAAMTMSKKVKDMKAEEKISSDPSATKWASDRVFVWKDGRWVDAEYKASMKTLEIAYASQSYFDLLALRPGLKEAMSLGTEIVIVVAKGRAVVIGIDIEGEPAKSKIKKFLK